ncbi:hypothetical protein MASR2M78_34150 [Treponema sp.]
MRKLSTNSLRVLLLAGFTLLILSFYIFFLEYRSAAGSLLAVAAQRKADFLATVLVSFVLIFISSIVLALRSDRSSKIIAAIVGLLFIIVLGYSMEGYQTLKLCLVAGFLIIISLRFRWPENTLVSFLSLALIMYFQRQNAFFGDTLLVASSPQISIAVELAFAASLGVLALALCLLRGLGQKLLETEEAVRHLDLTIDRLSEFNQDLQRYARLADEEAITKERNRISREIHDISGYIFTNLIALMDAAVSMGGRDPEHLAELHAAARAQAKEGLQETRRALHALRASDSHRERGINAIFKIKSVFERITGIVVDLEAGNMPPSFGDEIDLIIYRIVQEALTNAMRHGRASHVSIQFWLLETSLELCVKDNGIGSQEIAKGIGLSGMEERIGRLGGSLHAGNAAEGGFKLEVQIPLEKSNGN